MCVCIMQLLRLGLGGGYVGVEVMRRARAYRVCNDLLSIVQILIGGACVCVEWVSE